ELHLRHGSIRASKVTGDVDVEGWINDSNLTEIGGAGNPHGDFFGTTNVGKGGQGVRVKSSRTQLEIARLDGHRALEIGDLRVREAAGPFRVVTRSKDIHLDDVSGEIKVENSHGDVDLTANKPPAGLVDISNEHGHVSVELPAKSSLQVTA